MITISSKREGEHGAMWMTSSVGQKWQWVVHALPQLVRQDMGIAIPPQPDLQTGSDIELRTLPLYLLQVPAVSLFPYITYIVGSWFTHFPTIVIPKKPLNRVEGRNWLHTWTGHYPFSLATAQHRGEVLTWSDSTGSVTRELDYEKIIRLAAAARSYLLDEIRYVYDETASAHDGRKTSVPSRFQFSEEVVDYLVTKQYLQWYIDQFNELIDRFISLSKPDAENRQKALMVGWTINRLAVEAITVLAADAPYLRKWQFFSFLDALASLKNELSGKSHGKDKATAQEMLEEAFFHDFLLPVLQKIPTEAIRNDLISHTGQIYKDIASLGNSTRTGPQLLFLYRNSRHGYTLRNEDDRVMLLKHDGRISYDLPDLIIALWHYLVLAFPFT